MIDEKILDKICPVLNEDNEMEKLQARLKENNFIITNFAKGGVFYHLARMLAKIRIELQEYARALVSTASVKYIEDDWLEVKAADFSVARKPAQKARGYVTLKRYDFENALKVTKGHMFKTKPDINGVELKFYAVSDTVIAAGEEYGKVLVEAESEGTDYNVADNQIVVSMIYLDGVEKVTNESDWLEIAATDEESLTSLRERCSIAWSELAERTTDEKLESIASSVPGVVSVKIDSQHPRGQGTVNIIITGATGTASDTLCSTVMEKIAYLKDPCDDWLVKSANVVSVNIDIIIYIEEGQSKENTQAKAISAIREMFKITREEPNVLWIDDIRYEIKKEIAFCRKVLINNPADDMALDEGKVIVPKDISVTVKFVGE